MTIRVAIVDRRRLIGELLARLVAGELDMRVVGSYAQESDVLGALSRTPIDVVLLGVSPSSPGRHLEVIPRITELSPGTRFVAVIGDRQEYLLPALAQLGVTGNVSEGAETAELLGAIRAAAVGQSLLSQDLAAQLLDEYIRPRPVEPELTPRERTILHRIIEGDSNREIAERLGLSEKTVKNHVTSLLEKLGVRDRTQAAVYALQSGIYSDVGDTIVETRPIGESGTTRARV